MKLITNQDTFLLEELKAKVIPEQTEVALSLNYFTAYALFDCLDWLQDSKRVRILLAETPEWPAHQFLSNDSEYPRKRTLDQRHRFKKVLKLLQDKAEIRLGSLANQQLILLENSEKTYCFNLSPQCLNSVSLGSIKTKSPALIQEFEDEGSQYQKLFDQSWQHSSTALGQQVLPILENGAQYRSPQQLYKYAMREIFEYSTVSERADEKLQRVGFKDSKVWEMLYNFQKDAVLGAIEKIETYGGCIIADSVGLGKTFEALAVMKYYQLRNDRILVLAPKKLRENWTVYQLNDKRNILAEDRLNYDVLNHTDLSREKGKSGDIDLEMINWGNYDLVVIDESHNFRNNPNKIGITRYKRLMQDVIKSNIRTKVLMLSATPVNNRLTDLRNQVAFITEGDDYAFRKFGIESLSQVMQDAQRKFNQWFRDGDPENQDLGKLMEQLDGGYFRVLDMLTIARSRKHVEKYYDTAEVGTFPERLKPITRYPEIDTQGHFKNIAQVYDQISTLNLAGYSPLRYVRPDKQASYEEKYDMTTSQGSIFKQVDREESLIYLMRVNLLKRLESSILSFKLTLEKLIQFIESNLRQIEQHRQEPAQLDQKITEVDLDDTELEDLLVGGKTKVLLQDLDLIRWKQDLQHDLHILQKLMDQVKLIDPARDAKLRELRQLISEKQKEPINTGNKKVMVFTAFADTAHYLYRELASDLKKNLGLHCGLVTGGGSNKTNLPGTKIDLNSILTNFSPGSKNREQVFPEQKEDIDVLIGTDCISEGQNLQDCDFLVNYDIHWNPTRIIQRFGRIDRIGSRNERIQLVNFYPNLELDQFIDLVARVQGRMVMLDVSATGEDNIIAKNNREMQDLDYRKRQLQQLKDQVIDLEDVQGNISITDLTFNDFKIDLEKSSEEELQELDQIANGSFSLCQNRLDDVKPGVLFLLKDRDEEMAQHLKNNILYPHFLVYLSKDGAQLIKASHGKQALDIFRKLCMGNETLPEELMKRFEQETGGMKNMGSYHKLLEQALQNIAGTREEIGLQSLAKPGGTLSTRQSVDAQQVELIASLYITA